METDTNRCTSPVSVCELPQFENSHAVTFPPCSCAVTFHSFSLLKNSGQWPRLLCQLVHHANMSQQHSHTFQRQYCCVRHAGAFLLWCECVHHCWCVFKHVWCICGFPTICQRPNKWGKFLMEAEWNITEKLRSGWVQKANAFWKEKVSPLPLLSHSLTSAHTDTHKLLNIQAGLSVPLKHLFTDICLEPGSPSPPPTHPISLQTQVHDLLCNSDPQPLY